MRKIAEIRERLSGGDVSRRGHHPTLTGSARGAPKAGAGHCPLPHCSLLGFLSRESLLFRSLRSAETVIATIANTTASPRSTRSEMIRVSSLPANEEVPPCRPQASSAYSTHRVRYRIRLTPGNVAGEGAAQELFNREQKDLAVEILDYRTSAYPFGDPLVCRSCISGSADPGRVTRSARTSALLHHTLERADLLLEIAELAGELGQAAWLDLGLGELGIHRGSFRQQ